MRTVTYGAACSLDGFITAGDGALDWLNFSPDVHQVMADYWTTVDTILFGRKTWEIGMQHQADSDAESPIRSYLFSRTLTDVRRGVTLVSGDAGEFVKQLKREEGKDICVMSGGELASSLFAAGVIDKVGINMHPVLLGSGVPLFRDAGRRIGLSLEENRTLAGGCILANYRVLYDQ